MRDLNNKTSITRNTLYLYIRMFVTMGISIYTSRIVLQRLGVEDFGIYNVVGGVVALLNFFTNSLSSSYQRFFCIEIINSNTCKIKNILGTALSVSAIWGVVVVILAETLGLWLLNYKMIIPMDKMWQANAVFQLSIVTFILSLFQSVYNALIIAYERMIFFAYVSIFESVIKLSVAFSIGLILYDRLFYYGWLMLFAHAIILTVYMAYCLRNFESSRVSFKFEHKSIKDIFSFCSWSLLGTGANVLSTQGASILLNIFFGPIVNAARSISLQVYTAVTTFTRGFQTAFSPSMIKTYEQKDYKKSFSQILVASKISLYLTFLLAIPFFISTDLILDLWLGSSNVPAYTPDFVKLMILIGILEVMASPVINVIYAKGNIKVFQITMGTITLLILPIAYLMLRFHQSPDMVYYVTIAITFINILIRILFLKKCLLFSSIEYLMKVVFQMIFLSASLFVMPFIIPAGKELNIGINILAIFFVEILSIGFIYLVLCDKYEQSLAKNLLKHLCKRH